MAGETHTNPKNDYPVTKYYAHSWWYFNNGECCLCFDNDSYVRLIPKTATPKKLTRTISNADDCFNKIDTWVYFNRGMDIKPYWAKYNYDQNRCSMYYYSGGKRIRKYYTNSSRGSFRGYQ